MIRCFVLTTGTVADLLTLIMNRIFAVLQAFSSLHQSERVFEDPGAE